jgi:hypothetical protein
MKFIDLTNQKFNNLLVIEKIGKNKRNEVLWLCKCNCGNTCTVKTRNLKIGKVKSCGCIPTGPKRKTKWRVGDRINKVVLLELIWDKKLRANKAKYRCDCGKIQTCYGSRLNKIQSCGCHVLDKIRTGYKDISGTYWNSIKVGAISRNFTFTISIEEVWNLFIKQNKKCALSGIEISFYKSRNKYQKQTASLDRKDSTKGYTVDNIQWVHKEINRMKGKLSDENFIEWCRRVEKHTQN